MIGIYLGQQIGKAARENRGRGSEKFAAADAPGSGPTPKYRRYQLHHLQDAVWRYWPCRQWSRTRLFYGPASLKSAVLLGPVTASTRLELWVAVSYFPGIGRSQQVVGIAGASQVFSLPLVNFNAGFHLRIPIPKSRIIPGVISAGGIHTLERTLNVSYPNPSSTSSKTGFVGQPILAAAGFQPALFKLSLA
jgi:hypothetical protein